MVNVVRITWKNTISFTVLINRILFFIRLFATSSYMLGVQSFLEMKVTRLVSQKHPYLQNVSTYLWLFYSWVALPLMTGITKETKDKTKMVSVILRLKIAMYFHFQVWMLYDAVFAFLYVLSNWSYFHCWNLEDIWYTVSSVPWHAWKIFLVNSVENNS